MGVIELRSVSRSYGDLTAVHQIDLTIADKECLAVVGPSGAGKTTLLRMIAGLEEPDSGTITVNGVDLSGCAPSERHMGMIFQNAALFPHSTAAENIMYGMQKLGYSKADTLDRCHRIAALVHAEHLLQRYPATLSAGERQRIGIARALIRDPEVLLLDEPFSSLDVRLQEDLREEIMDLRIRLQQTMILVTHDQGEAVMMGDRIAVMDHGSLLSVDTPEETMDHPANIFTASFIGLPRMNLIPVHGGIWLGRPFTIADDAVVGFRAQDAQLGDGLYEATVARSVMDTGGYLLTVFCAGEKLTLRSRDPVPAGSVIRFSVETDHLHLFDRTSGRRINH